MRPNSSDLILQVVKNHIKLTLTGPATALGEDTGPEEMRDSFVTVLVARHFEAMWVHMKQVLDALPAPHHRLMDQVSLLSCLCKADSPVNCQAESRPPHYRPRVTNLLEVSG